MKKVRFKSKLIILVMGFTAIWQGLTSAAEEAATDNGADWIVAKRKTEAAGYDFSGYVQDREMKFSVNGAEPFTLSGPVYRKDDEIWLSLNDICPKMNIILLAADEKAFGVIRDDGKPLELKADEKAVNVARQPFLALDKAPVRSGGNFFMTADSIAKILGLSYAYDASSNTVRLAGAEPSAFEEFSAYTVEKPIIPESERPKPPVFKKPPPADVREEFLPPQYRRDVDLHVDTALSYLHDEHPSDRTRQMDLNISGRTYDYNMDGHLRMRDVRGLDKQRFKEDGEYLHIYQDNIGLKALDNYMALTPLRSQSQPYWGVELTDIYDPFKTTFTVGETDNTVSGPASVGSVLYHGNLYALRQDYKVADGLANIGNMLLWHETEAETQAKSSTTAYPRRNFLYVIDTATELYPDLNFYYTQAFSSFAPDNKVNKILRDDDLRFGVAFEQKRFSIKASYEKVGQQYASIGIPTLYQDFEGFDLSTNFRFTPNWYASIGGRLNRNNVERNPKVQTNYDNGLFMNTGISLPWRQNINLSYSATEFVSRGSSLDLSGNVFRDYRIDYVKGWDNLTAQLSYNRFRTSPRGITPGGSFTDAYSVNIMQFYPYLNNSNLRFYQDMRKTKTIADASYATTNWNTDIGGRLNITSFLSATGDWKVAVTQREALKDTAFVTLLLGGEFRSSPITTWNVDFSLTNFDLYDPENQTTKFYTVMFKLRHIFDVETPEKWGSVEALVYRDMNSNGIRDEGEPGIPKIKVNVVKGRIADTDSKGIALIKQVVPGDRKVRVDLSSLPLDMAVRGAPPVQTLTVFPLKKARVEFPIVATSRIKGVVYIDVNKNGKYDYLEDEGLPNVRVYLIPSGKETLTFSDGSYYMDYVYPGEHEIAVDLITVPRAYKISSPEKLRVSLKESETIIDMDFSFLPRPIKVESFD